MASSEIPCNTLVHSHEEPRTCSAHDLGPLLGGGDEKLCSVPGCTKALGMVEVG